MINGIIIIDKPKEYTSHDIVSVTKKIVKTKVGHTGTLDPNATGVLPLLLGEATKVSKYLINHDKTYEVVLKLGIQTTTSDGEGESLKEEIVKQERLAEDVVKEALSSFMGKQEQIPPIYSAIKVKGKKLYDYARSGQTVEIEPRKIEIYQMVLQKIDRENKEIYFSVQCSKGTYIRSLCEDIAKKLGTIGYMKELRRITVGEFTIQQSIPIEELRLHSEDPCWIQSHIISIEELFEKQNTILLEERQYQPFLNGVKLSFQKEDGVYRIYHHNTFLGLGTIQAKKLKRDLILEKGI